ncbi:hypothetical protein BKK51_11510 [Rodentibacter trehalosifermentans]|uniref:Protein beta n=1 Tax=Rodentibacter trehalosifermentans TaxID=1908263 RepID=A0A1V3IMM7_9PAST|nr:beta family protein [Rodentibacter trehalosifermentans]OOF43460.1 hypothetical protein BKK51_11510 [Rodentibacter trehalosifermentans]
MENLNFNHFNYYPTLRSRVAEIAALRELTNDRKDKIIPLITLHNWLQYGFDRAVTNIENAFPDRPFFLDLPQKSDFSVWNKMESNSPESFSLKNESSNFYEWTQFVDQHQYAIPVVQLSSRQRAVTQQAIYFENNKHKLAFRIRDYLQDTHLVINAISALQDINNVIVFIDCQYIRDNFLHHQKMCINTINQLRSQEPSLTICVLSTSFPISPAQFTDNTGTGSIDMLEHLLFNSIGGENVAIYGDHGSIHSVIYDDDRNYAWSARIDLPLNNEWIINRIAGTKGDGYPEIARRLIEQYPRLKKPDNWGEQRILSAATNGEYAKAPAPWISTRMNIHLSKQIDYWNAEYDIDPYDELLEARALGFIDEV